MSLLHIAFLLPFLSLFYPFSFAPSLSLDEATVLLLLPFAILMTPPNRLMPILGLILFICVLCVLNLSVIKQPQNLAVQIVNIIAYFSFFAFALSRHHFNSESVTRVYFTVLKLHITAGFLLIILYYVSNPTLGQIINWLGQSDTRELGLFGQRFTSLFQEPSHFVQFSTFGFAFLFFRYVNTRNAWTLIGLLVIGACLILTRSALAVAALAFPFLAFATSRLLSTRGIFTLLLAALFFYLEITFHILPEEVSERIRSLVAGFSNPDVKYESNASTRSLLHAIQIAHKTLSDTYGLGVGLGSYNVAFLRYTLPSEIEQFYNAVSGGSLLARVAAELGLIGMFVLLTSIYLKRPRRHMQQNTLTAMRWGCLAIIVVSMIRLGGYTTGLTPFAVIGYFFWHQFDNTHPKRAIATSSHTKTH